MIIASDTPVLEDLDEDIGCGVSHGVGRMQRAIRAAQRERASVREVFVHEAIEQHIERFAIELELRSRRRPCELEAARHRGDPHLAYGRVGADDELRGRRLLEDDLQDAVLAFELESRLIGKRQQ